MPLPPRGNPRRPLHLAVRSTRLLGIILVCFGAFSMFPMLLMFRRGVGMSPTWMQLSVAVFYLAPGILFLVCSI